MPSAKTRPFRKVLAWQLAWTALSAMVAGWLAGLHGAVSAALGGMIGIAGGLVFAWLVSRNRALTAERILLTALRAEGAKVLVLFGLLAAVLATYQNVVVVGLIGSFIISTLIFGFAFFVRDA